MDAVRFVIRLNGRASEEFSMPVVPSTGDLIQVPAALEPLHAYCRVIGKTWSLWPNHRGAPIHGVNYRETWVCVLEVDI